MSQQEQLRRPDEATLEVLFELSREAPRMQLEAVDGVDSKIVQATAVASAIIGLAAVGGVTPSIVTVFCLAVGVGAFIVGATVAVGALWSRGFRVPIGPAQLWDRYLDAQAYTIKEAVVKDIAEGFPENERHIADKHRALRRVLIALFVEAAAIGVALLDSAAA